MCGGTPLALFLQGHVVGLSPRVRGNQDELAAEIERKGSIPACAGEPPIAQPLRSQGEVYPRVCGGTTQAACYNTKYHGLSPRVRGNLAVDRPRIAYQRSIPACAGEPRRPRSACLGMQVYPRVCGGTTLMPAYPIAVKGLSPRVRGNRLRIQLGHRRPRSIPACAGEPQLEAVDDSVVGVYPRVCGGTSNSSNGASFANGLSPRVRGNPPAQYNVAVRPRSIPACAGEPIES